MKGHMFNIDNGYLEGLCRGFKNGLLTKDFHIHNKFLDSGILSQNDYLNLVQCETLEDLKLHLQSTDYGNFLANESSLQVRSSYQYPAASSSLSRSPLLTTN